MRQVLETREPRTDVSSGADRIDSTGHDLIGLGSTGRLAQLGL